MTSLVATVVFILLVTGWCSVAGPAPRRRGGPAVCGPVVFGRGVLGEDGRWRPVGASGQREGRRHRDRTVMG